MTASKFWQKLRASAEAMLSRLGRETMPPTVVVLGSGFKSFPEALENTKKVDFANLPHFPVPSVEGHGAALAVGSVEGREICVMTGRVHMYEGYGADEVVYPLRALSTVGVQNVVLTNAAGSVDPDLKPGSVVAIRDHVNLTGRNCLIGEARELGPVFVDMGRCYDKSWREAAMAEDGKIVEGVYAGVLGPNYETPAETAMISNMGCHVVGMSTVQEALAARHLGMKVLGLSFVTNMAGGLGEALDHQEVIDLVSANRERLESLLKRAAFLA